jgi:hypothetical protein
MKKILTVILLIFSIFCYSQPLQQIRQNNVVLEEGIDSDGDIFIIVKGEGFFNYFTYYFNDVNDNDCFLFVSVANIEHTTDIIRNLNSKYIKLDGLNWIDSNGIITINVFFEDNLTYVILFKI